MRLRFFLLLACVLLLPSLAWSVTYYTDGATPTNNSCASAVNSTTPTKTLAAGIACLSACDTLVVKAGTYNEIIPDTIPSGNASTPCNTVVRSETVGGAILKPNESWSRPSGVGIVTFGSTDPVRHHITLDGFVLDSDLIRTNVYVIYFYSPSNSYDVNNITVSNTEIRYTPNINATTAGDGLVPGFFARALTVKNNTFHHIGYCNQAQVTAGDCSTLRAVPCPSGGSCQAFYGYGMYWTGKDSLIEGNEIYEFAGYGIHMYNGFNGAADGNTFRNNYVHDGQGTGILFSAGGHNNQLYNNVVANNGKISANPSLTGNISNKGIWMGHANFAGGNLLAYNTVYGNTGACIESDNSDTNTVRNNICWANGVNTVSISGVGNVVDHNYTTPNPLFANAAAGDFHLTATSAAINQGIAISGITTDKDGNARSVGTGPDIGAYEYGSTATPPTNPIGWWKCDAGAGTTVVDSATGGLYPATLVNGATWSTGRVGPFACSCDGVDDEIQVTGLLTSPAQMSVTLWANVPALPSPGASSGSELFSAGDHVALHLNAGTVLGIYQSTAGSQGTTASLSLVGTGWHHYGWVVDPGSGAQRLYVDGVQRASSTSSNPLDWSGGGANTLMCAHPTNANKHMQGSVDEVKVWARALSAGEVQAEYGLRPSTRHRVMGLR